MDKPLPQETTPSKQTTWLLAALGMTALITSLHYVTDTHDVAFHNLYRRLYYLPILIVSFSHGLRGGVLTALLICAVYTPHAFFSHHMDPSPHVDKLLEMVLYVVVGGLTGWLVERQRAVQRELEDALEETRRMERQLVRAGRLSALGQLTSGLAHEIRNPLASILGCAEALATEFPAEHRKHRISQLLLTEINRLSKVVDDFLRFARPGAPEEYDDVDLLACAEEVRELTANQAAALQVALTTRPDPGVAAVVRGDAGQITQVALNVVLNAYQALEGADDDPPRRITFLTRAQEIGQRRFVQLGVRDNGPGIPLDHQEEVFNPYFTTRPDGTGLGLSISNRIMEAHGGFIDIHSQPGETTVWLSFPTADRDDAPR